MKTTKDRMRLAIGFLDTTPGFKLAEYKMFIALVSVAHSQLQSSRKYQVSVHQLMDELGYQHHNFARLEDSIEGLMKTVLTFNISGKDRNAPCWSKAQILGPSELKDGVLSYEFTQPVWEKLKDPIVYAYLSLRGVYQFKSKHDVALYNFFLHALVPKYQETTLELDLQELRQKVLNLKPNQYASYKLLNYKIISKSIRHLNKVTPLKITHSPLKKGRQVTGLLFEIGFKSLQSKSSRPDARPCKLTPYIKKLESLGLNCNLTLQEQLKNQLKMTGLKKTSQLLKDIGTQVESMGHHLDNPGGFIRTQIQKRLTSPDALKVQEANFYESCLHAYGQHLNEAAQRVFEEQESERFKEHIELYVPSPQLSEIFERHVFLKYASEAYRKSGKLSKSLLAQLRSFSTDLGYSPEVYDLFKVLKDHQEKVLSHARQMLENDISLKNQLEQEKLSLSELENNTVKHLIKNSELALTG